MGNREAIKELMGMIDTIDLNRNQVKAVNIAIQALDYLEHQEDEEDED